MVTTTQLIITSIMTAMIWYRYGKRQSAFNFGNILGWSIFLILAGLGIIFK